MQVTRVVVPAGEAELVADALFAAGASAVTEEAVGDGRVVLRADAAPTDPPPHWQVDVERVDDDGLDAWRAHARPVRVGERLVVAPAWKPIPPAGEADVVVAIDPGRAFGMGDHPTTRMVLARIERLASPGARVLDVGCGSGVLGIAALRLGAARVVAIDVDPEAIRATGANARRNQVADRIDASCTPLTAVGGEFDLVVANVGERVLVEHAAALASRTARGGHLVATGVLDADADRTATALAERGLVVVEAASEDGWSALVLRRPPER